MVALREALDRVWSECGDGELFVRRLQARMVRHGISQGALARASGFGPWAVSRWLGSRRVVPSMEVRMVLCEALEELIRGE